jgi:hypothetical protein
MYGETRITRISNPIKNPCHLLPAFDEYFVAYKDRPAGPGVTNWDLLGPTVIINGKVVGTWKRNATTVNLNLLRPVNKSEQRAIDKAVERYLEWLKT